MGQGQGIRRARAHLCHAEPRPAEEGRERCRSRRVSRRRTPRTLRNAMPWAARTSVWHEYGQALVAVVGGEVCLCLGFSPNVAARW